MHKVPTYLRNGGDEAEAVVFDLSTDAGMRKLERCGDGGVLQLTYLPTTVPSTTFKGPRENQTCHADDDGAGN
ncbi:hypothetical protein CHU98_g3006 [Xylaria longipes]|nr:hypothetical protein CHU98_g3006 [Xylaria longipes]